MQSCAWSAACFPTFHLAAELRGAGRGLIYVCHPRYRVGTAVNLHTLVDGRSESSVKPLNCDWMVRSRVGPGARVDEFEGLRLTGME